MTHFLVGTDFSTRSDRAVRRAVILAKSLKAELTLLHVVDDDQPRWRADAEIETANALLTKQVRGLEEVDSVTCHPKVALGDPFAAMIEAAGALDVDAMILGPHRRQVLRDVFVGTTAERIIRGAPCPVIMANAMASGAYGHVMFACDLSDMAATAIAAIRTLDLHRDAVITVLHIIDPPETHLMVRASIPVAEIEARLKEASAKARSDIAAAIKQHGLSGAAIEVRVSSGSIANSIAATAKDLRADLIIVATSGPSGLSRLMLGSVTESVLNRSDIDVLAVPRQRPMRTM